MGDQVRWYTSTFDPFMVVTRAYNYCNRKLSKRRVEAGSFIFNCNKSELLVNSFYKRSFPYWNLFVNVVDYLLCSNFEEVKDTFFLVSDISHFSWSFSAIISFNKSFSSWQTCQVFERRVSQSSESHLCSRHQLFVFSRMSFASCARRSRYPVILSNTDVDWNMSGTI
jgi:hypothetical protein